jgi:predicted O-methyltransferase YrrM
VFDFMRRTLPSIETQVKLLGCSPIEQQISQHRALLARARRFEVLVHQISSSENRLSTLEIASILRQATLIYGESNDEKLAALMAIFSSAPRGDVIEIGSLMGRSAFVLLYLAWRYRIGPVLSIDPWRALEAIQHKSPKEFQALVDEWDFEVIADGFMINMIPFRRDDHAHLRMTSEEGFSNYISNAAITSQLGQSISYSKKISVIHIDGNHDLDAVQKDCELWLDRMAPGGWVVLDDYLWAHGDGPYRVGNKLLQARNSHIDRSFVCGKALFIKFI